MARLELPVRSYIESVVKRAFPERDFSRGSGINDLVIKAFSVLMQPLRHEIDVEKVNKTLTNYLYMRPGELDALAANWGKFRQTGTRMEGVVRLYFNEAADYELSFLQFTDDAGTQYELSNTVSINTSDLVANRRADGTFYFDVTVRSLGIGDRYVVPAGSIRTVTGGPAALFACENVDDFQVTSPNESNYDVVNSMYRNIGLRNLVSRSSIRAPLLDNFSSILDIFVAGYDHTKMYRDLVDVPGYGLMHLGGTTDVWLNTNALSQRSVTLSYLPSTMTFSIVSSDQAAKGELKYSFGRGQLTPEGLFISPDDAGTAPDESYTVNFDNNGVTLTAIITAVGDDQRWPLAETDITGGTDLVVLPSRGSKGIYYTDPVGPNIANTPAKVGDVISTSSNGRRRITAKTGKVFEVSPNELIEDALVPSAASSAGSRTISITGIGAIAKINDRVRINTGAAAGYYTVLGVDTNTLTVGVPLSRGIASPLGVESGFQKWKFTGAETAPSATIITGAAVDEVKVNVLVTEVYFENGFDASSISGGDSITITNVDPLVNGTYLVSNVNTAGARHYVIIDSVLSNIAAPTGGTADVVRAAQYAPAELPLTADLNCWMYKGTDGAHSSSSSLWARVKKITRYAGYVELLVSGDAIVAPVECLVVSGLTGNLDTSSYVTLERCNPSSFTPQSVLTSTNPTFYCNTLEADFAAGTTIINAIGVGEQAEPGDLVCFTGVVGIPEADLVRTGGDGTKVTMFVNNVNSVDSITLASPFTFVIPAGTNYTITRNRHFAMTTSAVTNVNIPNKTVQLTSFQRGIGDAVGMAMVVEKDVVSNLTITTITKGDKHAEVVFSGSPDLTSVKISDKLVITDLTYGGTYRIISIGATSLIINANFGSNFSGTITNADIIRKHVNPIMGSTAGSVRSLSFVPPKYVFKLTMSSTAYSACSNADIGATVEQVVGNTVYRGVLSSYNNTTRIWEIEPNVTSIDVFSTTTTSYAPFNSNITVTPMGGSSKIDYAAGVDLSGYLAGDQLVLSGTTVNGTYFIVSVVPSSTTPYVIVSGNVSSYIGASTSTITRLYPVKILNSSAKAVVSSIDTNAGVGYSRGYTTPTSGDIGKIVRQGTYTGVLDEFSGTTWKVKPIGDSDLFDRTDVVTYVANSSTSPNVSDPQGTLLEAASTSAVDLQSVTFIVANPPVITNGDTPGILPRFSRQAGMIDGSTIHTNPLVSPVVSLSSATPGDILYLMNGDNIGAYTISQVYANKVTLESEPVSELLKIANAPAPQTLDIPSTGLNLSSPTAIGATSAGVWGGPGRIFQIVGGGQTYNLVINSAPTDDTIIPLTTINTILSPSVSYTWEILEGFHTDFWIVPKDSMESYRIYTPPTTLGFEITSGSKGRTTVSNNTFSDADQSFGTLVSNMDFGNGEVLLYIDSGSFASNVPYVISGVNTDKELTTTTTFTSTESTIQYRIVYKPNITVNEGWHRGRITSEFTIQLPVSSLCRNNTTYSCSVIVEASPYSGVGNAFSSPILSGEYNESTGVLTLDATDEVQGKWDGTNGFLPESINELVRVHFRAIDRNYAKNQSGSVVNTYNYYANNEFFTLPVVRVQAMQLLDPITLAPIKDLNYTFNVVDKGLRYSAIENNTVTISDAEAKFQPIRVTYIADSAIKGIDAYLNNSDTKVQGQNTMAKRMETMLINFSIRVRSEKTSSSIAVAVASYINSLRSNRSLTKAEIIQYLYNQSLITYVELDNVTMDAIYYQADGTITTYTDVNEVFGSDVSCYLSGAINITKVVAAQ